jgi:hypothetical protein
MLQVKKTGIGKESDSSFFDLQHQYEPRKPAGCPFFGGNRKPKYNFFSLAKINLFGQKKQIAQVFMHAIFEHQNQRFPDNPIKSFPMIRFLI